MSACPATSLFSLPRAGHARRSSPTCPPTCPTRALFLARMSVGDVRVYTGTCTIHDKLSCTRLQNYTICASLKSVSLPWNSNLTVRTWPFTQPRDLDLCCRFDFVDSSRPPRNELDLYRLVESRHTDTSLSAPDPVPWRPLTCDNDNKTKERYRRSSG